MASLNSCMFIGNLGKDAELRYLASGLAKLDWSLAVNYRRGETNETEWVNCVWFGERAEKLAQYLVKGTSLYVEGRLNTRTWDDDGGKRHYRTEIVVNTVQLLGGRHGGEQVHESRQGHGVTADADVLPFD